MANVNSLSDEFIDALRELVEDHRRGKIVNTQSKSRSHRENSDAPEVYIAKPVELYGIPPLSQVGTGDTTSPVSGDVPGSALCDIYRISSGQLSSAGFRKTVYNLSQDAIGYEWITVQRDKFGAWIARPIVRSILGEATEFISAGDPGTFKIYTNIPGGGSSNHKGDESTYSDIVRAYVRRGFCISGSRYILTPIAPGLEPGTSPTQEVRFDVANPTMQAYGICTNYLAMSSSGPATVGGGSITLMAQFGEIISSSDVWIAWDEVFQRFVGIQVPCPTGTGT